MMITHLEFGALLFVGLLLAGASRGHERVRRAVTRVGIVLSVILTMLWLVSFFFAFGYMGSRFWIYYESGGMYVEVRASTIPALPGIGWMGGGSARFPPIFFFDVPAMIPLFGAWMPAVAVAIPTLVAARGRKRRSPLECRTCGYNLTGNVSGTCPECGSPRTPDRPVA